MKTANQKTLVLLCMPLMEKGVGSAWGLPVVAAGKERLSALALSEKLEAPGALSINGNPHKEARLRELEAIGIGPLGRYLGGEPIKPVRIGSGEFFRNKNMEYGDTRWIEQGTAAELFHSHLEFLRNWGFSGGVFIEKEILPTLLADYIQHLQRETEKKTKIIVLMSASFFETSLSPKLPNAKRYGDVSAGHIPVNFCMEGKSAARAELSGVVIILYEELALTLSEQRNRCDICIAVRDDKKNNIAAFASAISARLNLDITASAKASSAKAAAPAPKEPPLNGYLYRNLLPAEKALQPALPFPKHKVQHYARQARIGCSFEVNAKFSGLRAVDFKEEQALFYREAKSAKEATADSPPPIRYDALFSSLNEAQLDFFIRWRSECRRGFITLYPNEKERKNYIESYLFLYAKELVLCMGQEGPLRHFNSLLCLFHACVEPFPETADALCLWLLDFAVLYDIVPEALPLLLDELWNNLWFEKAFNKKEAKTDLIVDLALCHFFVKKDKDSKTNYFEPEKAWPLFKFLIPQKILARKENNKELPAAFCKTLSIIDTGLRQDWGLGFFCLFYPQLNVEAVYAAFESTSSMGSSSYTAERPGFTSHRPLLEICAALALEPETNPLPGVRARLHPINLENELLEELRLESDAVREILKSETAEFAADFNGNEFDSPRGTRASAFIEQAFFLAESPTTGYAPPDKLKLFEFLSSLDEAEKKLIRTLARNDTGTQNALFSEAAIDAVNGAFYNAFGDLLIETGHTGPSISAEYQAILQTWE
jgi:hypothetical protein